MPRAATYVDTRHYVAWIHSIRLDDSRRSGLGSDELGRPGQWSGFRIGLMVKSRLTGGWPVIARAWPGLARVPDPRDPQGAAHAHVVTTDRRGGGVGRARSFITPPCRSPWVAGASPARVLLPRSQGRLKQHLPGGDELAPAQPDSRCNITCQPLQTC